MPFPDTLTPVPTAVPPDEHDVGAEDSGPNILNVIVPEGETPPESTADTFDAATAVPAVPPAGAPADKLGLATTVAVTVVLL